MPSDELIGAPSLRKVSIYCGSRDFLLHRRLLRWLLAGATALRGVHFFGDRTVATPLRNLQSIKRQCTCTSSGLWGLGSHGIASRCHVNYRDLLLLVFLRAFYPYLFFLFQGNLRCRVTSGERRVLLIFLLVPSSFLLELLQGLDENTLLRS